MKTIIFSDVHLRQDFDQAKYDFLVEIINKADKVIINGDFWEGYLIDFDQFAKTKWKGLFDLLKKKHTIYLSGNHERRSGVGKGIDKFCERFVKEYRFKSGGRKFVVNHGDKYDDVPEFNLPRSVFIFVQTMEELGVKLMGKSFLKMLYGMPAKKAKQNAISRKAIDEIVVMGHTHIAEVDLKQGFLNSGVVKAGLGQYLVIEGNRVELIEKRY